LTYWTRRNWPRSWPTSERICGSGTTWCCCPFTALARAFPWSVLVQRSYASVALLVEMLADDHAARKRPARELVTALIRVGAAGTPGSPAGNTGRGGRGRR